MQSLRLFILAVLALSLSLALFPGLPARAEPDYTPKLSPPPQQALVQAAAETVSRMRAEVPDGALDFLLTRARGVLVFPALYKAGFIGGLQMGDGVLLSRNETEGWSAPAFFTMASGSFGFQAGVRRTRLVVVLLDQASLDAALSSRLNIGADRGVLFGPAGGVDLPSLETRRAGAVAFTDAAGLFLGVSFEGGGLDSREDLNREYYGQTATARNLVLARSLDRPLAAPLKKALAEPLGDWGPDQLAPCPPCPGQEAGSR